MTENSKVSVRLSVLENKVDTLEQQHKDDNGNLLKAVEAIRNDIKEIFEFINKSKGSIAALLLAASFITGTVVAVVSWILTHFFGTNIGHTMT